MNHNILNIFYFIFWHDKCSTERNKIEFEFSKRGLKLFVTNTIAEGERK